MLSIWVRIEGNLCFRDILKSPLCKHFVYLVTIHSNVSIIIQGATKQSTVFTKIHCFEQTFQSNLARTRKKTEKLKKRKRT